MQRWTVTAYYLQDPDALVKARPDMVKLAGEKVVRAQAGKLALQTWHTDEHSRDLEVSIHEERADIGRIEVA